MRSSGHTDGSLRRSWRLAAGVAGCAVALLRASDGATAEIGYEVYTSLPPLAAERLSEIRGGIRLAGLDIGFGAVVHVLVDNTLVARSVLTMLDDGSLKEETTIADGFGAQPFPGSGGLGGGFPELGNARGIAIRDADGVTIAAFDIALSHTRSFLINTADRNIQQFVDVTLAIHNFDAVQKNLLQGRTLQRLGGIGAPDAMLLGN